MDTVFLVTQNSKHYVNERNIIGSFRIYTLSVHQGVLTLEGNSGPQNETNSTLVTTKQQVPIILWTQVYSHFTPTGMRKLNGNVN